MICFYGVLALLEYVHSNRSPYDKQIESKSKLFMRWKCVFQWVFQTNILKHHHSRINSVVDFGWVNTFWICYDSSEWPAWKETHLKSIKWVFKILFKRMSIIAFHCWLYDSSNIHLNQYFLFIFSIARLYRFHESMKRTI